jgi:hypothetical protein
MKKLRNSALFVLLLSIAIGFSSCLVGLRHDNGHHRGHYKNHRNYNTRVYVPYEGNHRTYKSKPLKEVHKYDDKRYDSKHNDSKRNDSKKNKWNSKK